MSERSKEEVNDAIFNTSISDPKPTSTSSQENDDILVTIGPQTGQTVQNNDVRLNPTNNDGIEYRQRRGPSRNLPIIDPSTEKIVQFKDPMLNPANKDDIQYRRTVEPVANASIKFDPVQQRPRLPQQMMPLSYPHLMMPGPRPLIGRPPLPFGPDAYRQPGMYIPVGHYRMAPPNIIRSPIHNPPPQNFDKNMEGGNSIQGGKIVNFGY